MMLLTETEIRTEFAKAYPNDIGILELAENNRDFAMEAIGARHHYAAFCAGARQFEAVIISRLEITRLTAEAPKSFAQWVMSAIGDRVREAKGLTWAGPVVRGCSTSLTPEGCAVESSVERDSVQSYHTGALGLGQGLGPVHSAKMSDRGTGAETARLPGSGDGNTEAAK